MRYIIDFYDFVTADEVTQFLADHGLSKVKTFDSFAHTYLVEGDGFDTAASYDIVERATADDAPVQLLTDTITVDPANSDHWWYQAISNGADIKLDEPWDYVRIGSYGTIYMVDSGCDLAHAEFDGRGVTNLWTFVEGDFTDQHGHGTALTSIISGKTVGASRVPVKQVKLFDNRYTTYVGDIISAFDAIIQDHIQTPAMKVVNLSWGIPRNATVESKIAQMSDLGLVIVCAAGNSGLPIEDVTPAAMTEAITVGAFGPGYVPSNFSNYTGNSISTSDGPVNHGALDIWAPGENITAALVGGGLGKIAGTSAAAAVASATLGGWLGSLPNRPVSEVMDEYLRNRGTRGLLDLSDPKYASSPNLIVAIRSAETAPVIRSKFFGIFHPGNEINVLLFTADYADSVTPVEMPEWLSIVDGVLVGTVPATEEITRVAFGITLLVNGEEHQTLVVGFLVPETVERDIEYVVDYMEPVDYVLYEGTCTGCGPPTRNYCCAECDKTNNCNDGLNPQNSPSICVNNPGECP